MKLSNSGMVIGCWMMAFFLVADCKQEMGKRNRVPGDGYRIIEKSGNRLHGYMNAASINSDFCQNLQAASKG